MQQALRDDAQRLVSLDEARRAFEYDYLVRMLKTTGGNVTQAARLAQRNRTEFYKLLQRHNLTPALFKSGKGLSDLRHRCRSLATAIHSCHS